MNRTGTRCSSVHPRKGSLLFTYGFQSALGLLVLGSLSLGFLASQPRAGKAGDPPIPQPAKSMRYPSPVDVALLGAGPLAVLANSGTDSISLVDLTQETMLGEWETGARPSGVAVSPDGTRVAVSHLWADSVGLFAYEGEKKEKIENKRALKSLGSIPVGHMPRGLAFSRDGKTLFVALAGANALAIVDLATKQTRTVPVAGEPRKVLTSADGKDLFIASSRSATIRRYALPKVELVWEYTFHDAFNLLGLTLDANEKALVTTQAFDRHHPIAKHNIEQGWAIDNRLGRLERDGKIDTASGKPHLAKHQQLSLDVRGHAAGDLAALASSPDGKWLAVAVAGTQELFVMPTELPWSSGDPGDFVDVNLEYPEKKIRKVLLGGRPAAIAAWGAKAVVANQLGDCVQVVDFATGAIERTISLQPPAVLTAERRGEKIFYDARRSHHQWFSCHTCHTDGHTSGKIFDTLADDSFGNPKVTPTLRGVGKTGPWGWHGAKENLAKSIEDSLVETLHGTKKPAAADVADLLAFLNTLEHPRNPHTQSDSAKKGEAIFRGKAACVRCHSGDMYTTSKSYEIGIEADGSPFDFWNPPSLRGVADRSPLGHEGKADTIDDFLRLYHQPEKMGGQAVSKEERALLVEFLRGL